MLGLSDSYRDVPRTAASPLREAVSVRGVQRAECSACVRACVRVCMLACKCVCARACVRACVGACVRACVDACVRASYRRNVGAAFALFEAVRKENLAADERPVEPIDERCTECSLSRTARPCRQPLTPLRVLTGTRRSEEARTA